MFGNKGFLQKALAVFESLPEEHYETAWTMCQIGRACFEMVKYPEAAQAFERARSLDPSRLEVSKATVSGLS